MSVVEIDEQGHAREVSREELEAMVAGFGPYLCADPYQYYGGIVAAKSFLRDRREVHVYPLLYGQARLCVGQGPQPLGYSEVWDYPNMPIAMLVFQFWDGQSDPGGGWLRHSQL